MQYKSITDCKVFAAMMTTDLTQTGGLSRGRTAVLSLPRREGREEARQDEGMVPFLRQQRSVSFLQDGDGHLAPCQPRLLLGLPTAALPTLPSDP